MSLVVTATDTDVGKTLVSAVLLTRYAELAPAYWKPIATGGRDRGDSREVASLVPAGIRILPEVYLYETPVSPHFAAQLEGGSIERSRLLEAFQSQLGKDPVVIEGIGGLMVPLNDSGWLLADLFQELQLPLLLVASTRVGSINHTLLSVEAARQRGLSIVGVVLTGPADESGNREAIQRFGGIDVIDVIPPLEVVSRDSVLDVALRFDPQRKLLAPLTRGSSGASP